MSEVLLACGVRETPLLVSNSGLPVAQLWGHHYIDYIVDDASGAVQPDSPGAGVFEG